MIKLTENVMVIESKEDFMKHYKANWNTLMGATIHGFNENSNFPIVVKFVESWDAHFCDDSYLLTDKEKIAEAFANRKNELKAELEKLEEIEKKA